jgi:hypothetical protein
MWFQRRFLIPLLLIGLAALQTGCASRAELKELHSQLIDQQQNSQKRITELEEELARTKNDLRHSIGLANTPIQAIQTSLVSRLEQLRKQQTYMLLKLNATERILTHMQQNNETDSPTIMRLSFEVQAMREAMTNDLDLKLPTAPVGLANATLPGWWSVNAIQWNANCSNAAIPFRSSTTPGPQASDWSGKLETDNRSQHSR